MMKQFMRTLKDVYIILGKMVLPLLMAVSPVIFAVIFKTWWLLLLLLLTAPVAIALLIYMHEKDS